jgi:5'-3' exonuclease
MNDLIVDGNSLFARSWFAVNGIEELVLRTAVSTVFQLIDRSADGRMRVAIGRTLFGWDGASKTDKKRAAKPKGYVETRYRFQEALLDLIGTSHGYHPDYEADDIVATAVFSSDAKEIYVISGDKDLMQLQGGNVYYYDLNTKRIVSPRVICQKFSIKRPNQLPIALAIMGDSGDKISGIPKWGPKKVAKLFESVTEVMDFSQAYETVVAQIPEDLLPFFDDSIDKTLLHTEIKDVPQAAPVAFSDPAVLAAYKLEPLKKSYERIAAQYESNFTGSGLE